MAKRIALAAIAVVGGVLLIFMFTRLSSADREAAAAVGRDAVTALLTEN